MSENYAMDMNEIETELSKLSEWKYDSKSHQIHKVFSFKGYYKTIAFVNFIAWQAQKLKHHPDLIITFGKCEVRLNTHDVNGISPLDFKLAQILDSHYF